MGAHLLHTVLLCIVEIINSFETLKKCKEVVCEFGFVEKNQYNFDKKKIKSLSRLIILVYIQ